MTPSTTATPKALELPDDVRDGGSFLFDDVATKRIFTPEDLSREQRALGETARRFSDAEVLPRIEEIEAQAPGLMRELLSNAGELGLLMLAVPEEYGGLGHDKTTEMFVTENLNRCASFAVSLGAHVGIGTLPLVYFGTPEQRERYLPKLASGEWIAAYALTEPGSGSDALAAKTRADLAPGGDHYVLNGAKQWITNAGFADLFVVFAQVNGEEFTALLVERASPGLTVGPEEHKHGIKGSSTCALSFDNVKVPTANVLGEIGKGHHIAFSALNLGRARLGIGCVGGSKYALEIATQYALGREQFGKPIAEFGLIRAKLADMAVGIYAGESLAYRTAGLIDRRVRELRQGGSPPDDRDLQNAIEEYAIETSVLKVMGSELFDKVIDETLQIHGGYGYMVELGIERALRDARINRIFEGTNEINRLLLAGTLLRRAMQQRLPLMATVGEIETALAAGTERSFEPAHPWLADLQRTVQRMKTAAMFAIMHAVKRYMMQIEDQQMILGAIGDMLIDVYAADSAVVRTLQLGAEGTHASFFADCASLLVAEAQERCLSLARSVLCGSLQEEHRAEALAQLAVVDRMAPLDRNALRERLAAAVVTARGWPAH